MKPAPFDYHDPTTVDEAASLLASLEDVKLLAGGQSLVPMLNMRFAQPAHIIDLNRIPDLFGIVATGPGLRIGAMTRQSELARCEQVSAAMPIMAEALTWVGHFQTRNRGTLGGSLCHLDPAAELPVVAALYGAEITVRGPDRVRRISFADWPLGYMMPGIAPDELATEINFPVWRGPHGHGFVEYARRHGDFAIVAVGCLIALDTDSKEIQRAALAIGGADQVVRRLGEVEDQLCGQPAGDRTFRAAADAAAARVEPMDDAYVPAAYRTRLVRVLTERALAKAVDRARAGSTGGTS